MVQNFERFTTPPPEQSPNEESETERKQKELLKKIEGIFETIFKTKKQITALKRQLADEAGTLIDEQKPLLAELNKYVDSKDEFEEISEQIEKKQKRIDIILAQIDTCEQIQNLLEQQKKDADFQLDSLSTSVASHPENN